ncbi:MAG TPA: glycosyltransferase, partial [Crocinitomix sp.]|nr:glycosyltransferase [Crocinitomix sp.]
WALTLTFLRKKGVINNFVFRCGGFDIWNERHEGGYLPFRGLIYKYADKIMPNTQIAEKYIKSLKLYPQKVQYKYLGTTDYGLGKFELENDLTIVSISNVIALKRVELIIDILKQVNINIKWVHFGDGNLLDDIKQKAKKISSKHKVIFKGEVPNKEIIEFFKTHTVHMLISTSSTEGLPVSMQEAISFGVPIIATNVGGVSEIVNHNTGLLLDKNFDINKPAKFINEFNNSEFNTMSKRIEIREFWNKRFNAQNIYTEFSKELKKLL